MLLSSYSIHVTDGSHGIIGYTSTHGGYVWTIHWEEGCVCLHIVDMYSPVDQLHRSSRLWVVCTILHLYKFNLRPTILLFYRMYRAYISPLAT